MAAIVIDGVEYSEDSLSDDAKAQLASLLVVDRRLAGAQEELAILQTARAAYARALKSLLDGGAASVQEGPARISWPTPQ